MRQIPQEEIADLIEQGFIENVNAIQTGNQESYAHTEKMLPFILTAKGFRIIAEIYFSRILNAQNEKGKLAKIWVLTDPNPQHHNCTYSADLDAQFKKLISNNLLIGQIEFIPIYGGHATLMARERLADGTYQYLHFDSSTAIGGIYPPASQLYKIIREVHPNAKMGANYDRTQKTTPGCHPQTLYVMLQMGLSLAKGEKLHLDAFMQELDETKKEELKETVINPSVKCFEKKSDISKQLDSLNQAPYYIKHYGLFPEALCIAQGEEIFSKIEDRKKNHSRDERMSQKIKRSLDPENPKFSWKSEKVLMKMLACLMHYKNQTRYRNGELSKFEIAPNHIQLEIIGKIASLNGNSEKLFSTSQENQNMSLSMAHL